MEKIIKSQEEWKKILPAGAFHVTREHGTERAFTGSFHDCHKDGVYHCVCCELPLFDSRDKFDSGTGWPSYTQPVALDNVEERIDKSFFTTRTEILCQRCEAHLGHVFCDGPLPKGVRYCINSVALTFKERIGGMEKTEQQSSAAESVLAN